MIQMFFGWLKSPGNQTSDVKGNTTAALAPNQLPGELIEELALNWLNATDLIRMGQGIQTHHLGFFGPIIKDTAASYAVLTGRPKQLLRLLEKDCSLFFKPCKQVTDPAGQIFYNVSPIELIYFLGDEEMLCQVFEFVHYQDPALRDEFLKKWKAYHLSRERGGADLVMLKGDCPPKFTDVCQVVHRFDVAFDEEQFIVETSLLTNPDGLVCWKSPDEHLYWYYACSKNQSLELLELPEIRSEHDRLSFDAFCARMNVMENNTARRSSDEEHQLIQRLMRHVQTKQAVTIDRKGIVFQQDGIKYTSTCYDINRVINAYIKYLRLDEQASILHALEHVVVTIEADVMAEFGNAAPADEQGDPENPAHALACAFRDEASNVWRNELGHVQREVMWLLQRYCELSIIEIQWGDAACDNRRPFIRCFNTTSTIYHDDEPVFDIKSGMLSDQLGGADNKLGFAIARYNQFKGRKSSEGSADSAVLDLYSVNRLFSHASLCLDNFDLNTLLADEPNEFIMQSLGTPFF